MMYLTMIIGVGLSAIPWTLGPLFFGSLNTVYSADYSEGKFRKIHAGMNAEEVETLLGTPLAKVPSKHEDSLVWWRYTDTRSGRGNYWKREIWFVDNKVVDVVNIYWYD